MTEGRLQPPPWREVFQGSRGRLITGLLLLESLVAVYALLITAIMPAVRDDIGGTNLYGFASAVWGLATIMSIPIAGHAADKFGPRKPLIVVMVVMIAGMAVSGLAPTIAVFITGLFMQGFAGGALYAVSLGTVAKTFPENFRARVMALLATMWILPGLAGPALGATIAEHVGWRWAFAVSPPLMLAAVFMVLPALGRIPEHGDAEKLPLLWSALTTFGLGLFLGGTATVTPVGLAIAAVGLAVGVTGLLRIVPRGTLSARPGVPAAAASMFPALRCFLHRRLVRSADAHRAPRFQLSSRRAGHHLCNGDVVARQLVAVA